MAPTPGTPAPPGQQAAAARPDLRRGRRSLASSVIRAKAPAAALAALLRPVRRGWQESAACRDVDPDLFYPDRMTDMTARRAKRICRRCPVREACLRLALATDDRQGVFGGTTPQERWLLHYNVAVAARSLAEDDGVSAAARRYDTTPTRLYRAWDLWGLGRPSSRSTGVAG